WRGEPPGWLSLLLAAGGGALSGLLPGWFWPGSWRRAALVVDERCRLKDRVLTALAFSAESASGELQRLQIEDALDHLRAVDARRVVPLVLPRALPGGCAALLLAAAIGGWSGLSRQAASPVPAGRPVDPRIWQQAESLETGLLAKIEDLAKQHQEAEVQQLARQLQEMIQELKLQGAAPAEALAQLSDMQAAIAAAQARLDPASTGAALDKIADALAPAESLQAASEALRAGKYEQAAELLEAWDATQVDPREGQAVAEQLQELSQAMQQAGQEPLGEAAETLAEGLARRDAAQAESAAEQLASESRRQEVRQEIAQALENQLLALAESKSGLAVEQSGGDATSLSQAPKTTWGRWVTDQPFGTETTPLETTRQQQDLTGTLGEGPSQRQVTRAAEATETATRGLTDRFQQYQRQSEAVLESEPLPLGQRATIRRYFQSIRPDGETAAAAALQRQLEAVQD
ncbi:MAG: hypothetical protein J5I93_24520, partial [Pirellulaceae bacterium]|nr:hypothetical protein [Pirellulaceae bacterium]